MKSFEYSNTLKNPTEFIKDYLTQNDSRLRKMLDTRNNSNIRITRNMKSNRSYYSPSHNLNSFDFT